MRSAPLLVLVDRDVVGAEYLWFLTADWGEAGAGAGDVEAGGAEAHVTGC